VLNQILKNLPIEMSFVGENDEVMYYTDNKERIFPRSPGVTGRKVQNCYPHKSLYMVESILKSFKSGEKDHADFWINLHGKLIYIRYFAIRDEMASILVTLEVPRI